MQGYENKSFDQAEVNGVATNGKHEKYSSDPSAKRQVYSIETAVKPDSDRAEVDDEYEEEELRCGYGNCTPDRIQCCNNPKAFLVFICFCAFAQGKPAV